MIRRVAPNDYQAILEINERCHNPNALEPRDSLVEKLRFLETWVFEEEGKVVGFLIGRQGSENSPANIYNVAVLPEFRKRGIAASLIQEFEKFYAGKCIYYYLHVDAQNPAQKLYFDLGYRVLALANDFYGDRTIALRMVKSSY